MSSGAGAHGTPQGKPAQGVAAAELLYTRYLHWVVTRPDAVALECAGTVLTYRELHARVLRLARGLAAEHVCAGERVVLLLAPSLDGVTAMLAVQHLRAAFVPVAPDLPVERLISIVGLCSPRLVVAAGQLREHAAVISDAGLRCRTVAELSAAHCDGKPGITPASAAEPDGPQPDDLAYIMFTSGTTGEPRGVCVTHANLAGLYSALPDCGFGPEDCWAALHAPSFGFSVWEIWGALSHGGRLLIVPAAERSAPAQWDARIRAGGVTVLSLTPSGLRQWLAADLPCLGDLRLLVLSGEALALADWQNWRRLHAHRGPAVLNTYALTETAGRIATHWLTRGAGATPAAEPLLGFAAPDAELWLLDPESLQPVADGEEGELFAAGPMLAVGYWQDEAATAARFVSVDPGDGVARRCYRTGDRAVRLPDGALRFSGRRDEQIKLRGYRVELPAIEAALCAHPQVAAAAVLVDAGPDTAASELLAFAVPGSSAGANALEFWPSLGEYQIYDGLLYDFMAADAVRVASYRDAYARHAAGKVVLDIGTGRDALLARLCVAAGARHVYAVEVLPDAAAHATEVVNSLGLGDRITVICGDIAQLELPEAVELCTQGIVGNIGSSDGIASIWNAARRLFAPDCIAVPARCTTFIAPAELPAAAREAPCFGPLAADYARRIFAAEGREFDVRLCVRNFPATGLLAPQAVFEALDFSATLPLTYTDSTEFVVARDGVLDGFVLWTRLANDVPDEPAGGVTNEVDFFDHQQAWLPVWLPLPEGGVTVHAGCQVQVSWSCETPPGQPFPDYALEVRVSKADATELVTRCVSRHHETALCATPLHEALHATLRPDAAGTILHADSLRDYLATRLPAYMVPQQVHLLGQLPLNANRKLDRQALRVIAATRAQPPGAGPEGELEEKVGAIWCGALGRDALGREQNFFDAGGDSIAAVRVTTEVQRWLDTTVFLTALYSAPTLAGYCTALAEQHGDAVQRALASLSAAAGAATLRARAADEPVRLAPAQQSLWFLHQLYPHNTAANEQFLVRVTDADPQRLEQAWCDVVGAHDILRAYVCNTAANGPELRSAAPPPVAELAAISLAQAQRPEQELRLLASAEIKRAFALDAGELVRAVRVILPAGEQVLLVTAHHIVADGLCIAIIRDELLAAYDSGELMRPALQYADFAAWQLEQQPAVLAGGLAWWAERLAGADLQPLVATSARPDEAGPQRRVEFELAAPVVARLRELARSAGASLFMLVAAVWRVWLSRCFARTDVLIGTPVTQRNDAATAGMLGCLVNNVVLRNPIADGLTFSALLAAERAAVIAALEHADVPFAAVVAELDPPRVLGRHPVFQAMLQYEDYDAARTAGDGARFATDVLAVDRASYWDIELAVREGAPGDPLRGFLGFRTDLLPAGEVQTWPAGLATLFAAIAADAAQPLATLPLISEDQRAVRADSNATPFSYPHTSLCELVLAQARRTPDLPAIHAEGGVVSYAELHERVGRFAAALQQRGVSAGDVVGVRLAVSVDAVAALLAINGLGAVWLPLDPAYPPERVATMLAVAAPRWTLCAAAEPLLADGALLLEELRGAAAAPDAWLTPVPGEHLAVLFTSGSTGAPKGALVAQAVALSRCLWFWRAFELRADDMFAQRTSLNFIDSIWELFGPLLHGGSVALATPECAADPRQLARWLAAEPIAHAVAVPALLTVMLDEWEVSGPPAKLRLLICSGDVLPTALAQRFAAVVPHAALINTYGTSENWDITAGRVDGLACVDVGRPVANTQVHIRDQQLQELPNGVSGDLYVGGLAARAAYLHDPERTAARRCIDPLTGAELYATGDRASWTAAGRVRLQGRADRQLKLRGVRVEPGEIESLAARYTGVELAAVALRSAGSGAASADWLALYVVASPGLTVDLDGLRDWLSARLPRATLPADYQLLDALPLTPSGKLDVAALPDSAPATAAIAPRTDTERRVLAVWQDVLSQSAIGVTDDFFALRGNSLLATRVMARVCDEFAVDLPLACLFSNPTVAGLAQAVDGLTWALHSDRGGQADGRSPGDSAADREVVRL